MCVIDDYSRKIWIYILKEKSEAFSKFKEWCSEVEKDKSTVLKCLRTDNGLEYLSKEFDQFCKKKGIERHKTVPLNPQQNGIAERANRTIMERVRCMLLSSGMEKRFWAEAVSTVAKVLNKCPSSSIGGDTPDSRWYGRLGDYSFLKVFGCKAYAHNKSSKLDARALRCVMLGYQPGVKGYRLWCIEPGNHKVIISRDVVFVETEMPYLAKDKVILKKQQNDDDFEVEVERSERLPDIPDNDETSQEDSPSNLRNYMLARDRTRRTTKLPARFDDSEMLFYALCVAEQVEYAEPATYDEAMDSKEWEKWMKAMIEEIDSLLKNGTWVLVDRPDGRRIVASGFLKRSWKQLRMTG